MQRGRAAKLVERSWSIGLRRFAPLASLVYSACNPGSRPDDPHSAPFATHAPAQPAPASAPPVVDASATGDASCVGARCDAPTVQRFVIIGDYGLSGPDEASVARLVASVKPDFVVTTGDNNYPLGSADTIDENVGRYFHAFITPYHGKFGNGADENRFFPSAP